MKNNSEKSNFTSFFKDFKENLSEGAQALSKISLDIIDDVKDKAEELYETGSEKFEQASGVVHSYIDKYKGEEQIRELSNEKEELNAALGESIFHEFKKNGVISKRFLTTKKMIGVFDSIGRVDKEILRLGKQIDKAKSKK